MAKYRKKPVVIEAEQVTDARVLAYAKRGEPMPEGVHVWMVETAHGDVIIGFTATINTLEGEMRVSLGDWIITGIKGERYACKPDIFAATYEAVGDRHE